jgi:hypothetical protein
MVQDGDQLGTSGREAFRGLSIGPANLGRGGRPAPGGRHGCEDNPKRDSTTRFPAGIRRSALFPSFGTPAGIRPCACRQTPPERAPRTHSPIR